ncbi:MAG: Hsp20/alpha crystallin family protein, partial [Halobacteriota archaeon]
MRRDDRDDPLGEFFEEFERMMNEMFGGSSAFRFETMTDSGGETHVDVYEEDDHVRVVADLPGVEKSDINVTCDGRVVHIRADGERRSYD